MLKYLVSLSLFCFVLCAKGQNSFLINLNYNQYSDHSYFDSVQDELDFSLAYEFHLLQLDTSHRFSFTMQFGFESRGFTGQWEFLPSYALNLNYLNTGFNLNYKPNSKWNFALGIKPCLLISTDVEHGLLFYNNFDLQLGLSTSYRVKEKIALHVRFNRSVIPLMDYHVFDEFGNFINSFRDGYFFSFEGGIRFYFTKA